MEILSPSPLWRCGGRVSCHKPPRARQMTALVIFAVASSLSFLCPVASALRLQVRSSFGNGGGRRPRETPFLEVEGSANNPAQGTPGRGNTASNGPQANPPAEDKKEIQRILCEEYYFHHGEAPDPAHMLPPPLAARGGTTTTRVAAKPWPFKLKSRRFRDFFPEHLLSQVCQYAMDRATGLGSNRPEDVIIRRADYSADTLSV
ncbi:unnamed protein product [Amoebophrya sp. A120]|nr:unnamed protein product [Amoebophrya sp. A120]|eukprot:GSA120T00007147001.1